MRRAWIHRFIGLLWLALCSTAVLPWAHELGHLSEHGRVAAPTHLVQQAEERAADAPTAASQSGTPEGDHAANACLVCLHLFGQHLAPAPAHGGAALAIAGCSAPRPLAVAVAHAPPAWLTPAPRAPPAVTA